MDGKNAFLYKMYFPHFLSSIGTSMIINMIIICEIVELMFVWNDYDAFHPV